MTPAKQDLPWVVEALRHVGQREIPGKAENSWIVSLWRAIKRGGIKSEAVPWCAALRRKVPGAFAPERTCRFSASVRCLCGDTL